MQITVITQISTAFVGNLISAAALIRINTVLRGIAAFLEEKLGKGRTIRKVMEGEGNFRAARIFFRYQILCMNFI